jgi:hypothetical protein
MPAFGDSDLDRLEKILEKAVAAAKARKLGLTQELIARRLFEAVQAGKKSDTVLIAAALEAANDDDPFPPAPGMRPVPHHQPIWPGPGFAAATGL